MKASPLPLLIIATWFAAQSSVPAIADPPTPRKVTVVGTCIIKVVPDQMRWSVQVSINDQTLAKAKARHDTSLAAVLNYLKSLGGAVTELQTGGIRFDKNLYPGDSSFLKGNPFSCSTEITFTLVDFDKYGPIADALSKIDGSQVNAVDYASSKEAETRRDALKRALLDGHDKAADLAEVAGCAIDKPLSIDEQEGFGVQPEMMNATFRGASSGTPSAVAGQISFSARVIVSYDLLPK